MESLARRYAFGAGLDLDLLGFELDDSTLVPGVAVESSRAKPLAGKFVLYQIFSQRQCQCHNRRMTMCCLDRRIEINKQPEAPKHSKRV